MNARNAFYAQSGGVTAVINASACGLIETARQHRDRIANVYAGHNGIFGALTEDLIDTNQDSDAAIAALYHTPAGAFGSCRMGLPDDQPHYCRLLEVFKAHDIGYFFYNGGNGSQVTTDRVAKLCEERGYPIQCIGIPKTIDNDLSITDNCPGYGSAAKYVAISTLEASFDVASLASTSTKVFVLEVMGRHAGWIAAAGALASKPDNPIPVIILFPEVPFDKDKYLAKVKAMVDSYGYCSVVAAEGVQDKDGQFLSVTGKKDIFGHSQLGGVAPVVSSLVKEVLGYKCHWAVADYMQRSAGHIASKTDMEQAYAVGKAAVKFALEGRSAIMPTIVRLSNSPYRWEIGYTPLANVANVEKKVPREFISADGFDITDACRVYLQPLITGEAYPAYLDGIPDYPILNKVAVPKKLNTSFVW